MNNTGVVRLTEEIIVPILAPKRQKLIDLIGEDELTRQTSFALQMVNGNKMLMETDPKVIAQIIWNVAITKLSLNPVLKLAYIVPFKGSATLMPSYQGLVKLVTDTGSVSNAYAYPVYKGDDYECVLGTETTIKHKRKHKSLDIECFYAVGVLPDGNRVIEEMGLLEVYAIRERSESYKSWKAGKIQSAIWETDFVEMGRKTVLKRLTKYLPKTDRWNEVSEAIDLDNEDYAANDWEYTLIENMCETSTYDEPQRNEIMRRITAGLTHGEAKTLISDLNNNQLRAIDRGNMSAGEIGEAVNDSVNADNT